MRTGTNLNAWLVMAVILLGMAPAVAAGGTIYVDVNTPDNNDGSSWAKAYKYLQDALADANSNVDVNEIWVAQGTYKPDEDSDHPDGTGQRQASFWLINGVEIKGGYAGFGEPDPNARDIELYETVLSGDLKGDDVGGLEDPSRNENSYHVVTGSGTDDTAILDGFIIIGGRVPQGMGGGMYNKEGSPTVMNCAFIGNSAPGWAGGGMYNTNNSSPTLINCTFLGNSAGSGYGGGMSNSGGSPRLISCTFRGNFARWGGGMTNSYSNPRLINCKFSGNLSEYHGAGMFNHPGDPILTGCTFTGNRANGHGGGVWNSHGVPRLSNCILWGDMPEEIYVYDKSPVVTYSDVEGGWVGGNIDADPCFVEAGYWDVSEAWVEGDYHLLEGSPCIDAGDNNSVPADTADLDGDGNTTEPIPWDLDGNPRIIGGRVDMGAYEFFNTPPVACIVGGDRVVEVGNGCEARVTLDGSCSSDGDSTLGTNDDIVYFDWYEVIDPCDPNSDIFLGSGEIIECNLPLGEHDIILGVIDKADASDANEVTIIVEDTTPPEFSLSVTPDTLWPANHKMVKITPSWEVSDNCDGEPEVTLVSITMDEEDDAKGDGHTSDDIQVDADGIWLRAERSGKRTSRVYTITYRAVDDSGNVTVESATVTVPHDRR